MLDAVAAPDQYTIRFTAEPLRERERQELAAHGKTEFENLFANIRFAMGSGFGTKVRSSARSTRAIICVPTKIHATIPEVAEVFFSDRTNAAIGFAQSQAIYNFLEPSADHPLRSCGLRWSLWHSPSKLIRQRDICYIEYMDTFVDENGRRGWARCTQSIHHRSCPPLVNSHNIVRAHLGCSGTIYTESDTPGVLDVITLYDCDTKGLPAWMTKFVALRKAKNAHLLEHLIRLARAANDSLVADFTKIEPQKPEKACFGCGDMLPKWSVAGRKCRECHEPLCKSCNDIVYCAIEGGKKLNRICMHCVDRFLGEGSSERRIDMYTDSPSQHSGRGGSLMTPRHKFSREGSDASSHRSTKRLSDSSHSGSTTDGAGLESPTPLLEDKPTPPIYSYQLPPQVQLQQRHHHQPPHIHVQPQVQQHPRHQSQAQQQHHRHRQHQAQQRHQPQPAPHAHPRYVPVPLAPKESPALINLGVSRYKAKKSGDVDLSYLSNFKSVNARS